MRVVTHQITFTADEADLIDEKKVYSLLDGIVAQAELTKVNEVTHRFSPQGISIVYVLAESHIAIHTWPEDTCAYVTLSSCGDDTFSSEKTTRLISSIFGNKSVNIQKVSS